MPQTKKPFSLPEGIIANETETNSANDKGSSIVKHSRAPSTSFAEEISNSMSYLDVCGKHLIGTLTEINPSEDGSDVMAKCEVAKQIANLARVKLDFIKALK